MADFGTMADFDAMLAGIKQRHMRLIIDLVANHTSDEHKLEPPNNYRSVFSGSAWQFDPKTNEYYLHYFAVKQPDLNWDSPKVRQEVFSIMRFWLDNGVHGFRWT
jgi:oligo-1,6-glucosidase